MSTYVIHYDEVPKSLNAGGAGSRRHWSVANREKKRWEGIWLMLMLAKKIPRGMERCEIGVWLAFALPRRRDVENFRPAFNKPFADMLVKGGYIPDDTAEFFNLASIEICPEKLQHAHPLVKGRTTIKIEADY